MTNIPPELIDIINDILAQKSKEETEQLGGDIEELQERIYIEDFIDEEHKDPDTWKIVIDM